MPPSISGGVPPRNTIQLALRAHTIGQRTEHFGGAHSTANQIHQPTNHAIGLVGWPPQDGSCSLRKALTQQQAYTRGGVSIHHCISSGQSDKPCNRRRPMAFLGKHWLKLQSWPTGQHCCAPGHQIWPATQAAEGGGGKQIDMEANTDNLV